jgi:hypothetical protein
MRRRLDLTVASLVAGALMLAIAPSASASIRFVTQWGSEGTGAGQLQSPWGIAIDSGSVYVVEHDGDRVDKFTSSGAFITSWGSAGSGPGQLTDAADIAVGASGNVYVADTGNDRVQEFTPLGSFIRQWGGPGTGDGQFDEPTGIATDSAGNVYVAEAESQQFGEARVQKFDPSGSFLAKWQNPQAGGGYPFPTDITIDASDNVYVTGFQASIHPPNYGVIQKYDTLGNNLATRYITPTDVVLTTDPSGRVFGAGGSVVKEYDSSVNLNLITQWGSFGSKAGQFRGVRGLTTNSAGRIYVADAGNNRIQVFRQSAAVPNTTITGGPHGTITDRTPTFRFSSPDLDATFACKVDSTPYKSCRSPRTTQRLANGAHTFRVRATDPNGTDPTPAVRSFTVKSSA